MRSDVSGIRVIPTLAHAGGTFTPPGAAHQLCRDGRTVRRYFRAQAAIHDSLADVPRARRARMVRDLQQRRQVQRKSAGSFAPLPRHWHFRIERAQLDGEVITGQRQQQKPQLPPRSSAKQRQQETVAVATNLSRPHLPQHDGKGVNVHLER